jgi:predicted amidohydrolase
MPRTLKIAPVQMDVKPEPVARRLERAADLIAEAVSAGAQVVVLPEVFNTGYEYSDANYTLAEPMDGPTVTWMKNQAALYNIHLAGSLLLLDDEDIYNSALLIAPDGRLWRYDKHYPWLWERAYFREGERITVADTGFGRVGMMICHDYNHAELWERYAGKVDLLLVISSPPRMYDFDLIFPDGLRLNINDVLGRLPLLVAPGRHPWGDDLNQHAAWMRVPVVATLGSGLFRSRLPQARLSLVVLLGLRPDLWERIPQADETVVEAGFDLETKVVDAAGQVLARVTEPGDGFTLAEVTLPDERPTPGYPQPKFDMRPLTYLLSDIIGPALLVETYRQGARRVWGARMAPVDPRTRLWLVIALAAALIGWFLGRGRRR